MNKKLLITAALAVGVLATTNVAFAADNAAVDDVGKSLIQLIVDVIGILITYYLIFATLIWVVYMLVHTFAMLGKSDNRSKDEAKEKLITTVKTGIMVIVFPAIIAMIISLVYTNILDEDVLNGKQLTGELEKVKNLND